jgi:hypothetical protein
VTYAIEDRRPEDFVRIGRVIQRTLNALARAGVSSASVLSGLYLLDVLGSNPEIFSRREIRVMARARAALERFFATSARNIVYIIRIGVSDPPTARQGRRPVDELLLEG